MSGILRFQFSFAVFVTALLVPHPVPAAVVLSDDPVFGTETVVTDLDNDRHFLRLDFTTPYTYDQVVAELNPGGIFAGWRVASKADLDALAASAGITNGSTDPTQVAMAEQLRDWFCVSCVRTSSTHIYSRGLVSDFRPNPVDPSLGWVQDAYSFGMHFHFEDPGQHDEEVDARISGWGPATDVNEEVFLVRGNAPPVFDPIGSEIVWEQNDLTFTVSATDADNDPLIYAATNLPSGADFDPATQTFSWRPNNSQAGKYFVTFAVNDGVNPDVTERAEITVFDNDGGTPKAARKKRVKKTAAKSVEVTPEGKKVTRYEVDKAEIDTDYDLDIGLVEAVPPNASVTTTTLEGCLAEEGFQVAGHCFDVTTDAISYETAEICVTFDADAVNPDSLELLHYDAAFGDWSNVTTSIQIGNNFVTICGVSDLSPFFTITNSLPFLGDVSGPMDPQPVGAPVTVQATFSDADPTDTHAAEVNWGDGTVTQAIVDELLQSIQDTHSYAAPGVYAVALNLTDGFGDWDEATFQFVVVYDPEGAFVTGGGWFDSVAGAFPAVPSMEGKATFGFVSKYKKGASIPTGNTEFKFSTAHLNFHSADYQWLVVAGPKAQFKGSGTINGSGLYGFMVTAVDAKLTPSTVVDLFRIKIWDENDGDTVIYDNQIGAPDDSDSATAIGGGSIVVHKN